MGIDDEFCNNGTNKKYKSKVSSAVTVSDYALHDYFGIEVRLYFLGLDRDSKNFIDKSRDFTGNRYKQ
ncbi:hypothetical protein [uncultured Phascolarctobacterium sp.]|uniref:hypothetical protein n=1 Tax=uncultured Phascolarctobacterium sp. TaxID=512296 RepID=UPI0025E7DF51|nr:hypothetical protein [uncultured Phascolarctobacterium sp.]